MEYAIQHRVLAGVKSVALTLDEFNAINASAKRILLFLRIEDKFRLMLDDYAEFEGEIARLAVHEMVYLGHGWGKGHDIISLLSRRCLNVLNAAKMYSDHIVSDIAEVYGADSEQRAAVKAEFSRQFDENPAYRCGCELRNHAQHSGLPLTGISSGYHAILLPPDTRIEVRVRPRLILSRLQNSDRIRKKFIPDFDALAEGGYIDLGHLMRVFVGCLTDVHKRLREIIATDLAVEQGVYRQAIERFEGQYGKLGGMEVVSIDSDLVDSVNHLIPALLERSARPVVNGDGFRKRFISTRSDGDDKIYVDWPERLPGIQGR